MSRSILLLILVLVVAGFIFVRISPKREAVSEVQSDTPVTQSVSQLPAGWKAVDDSDVLLKLEKTVDQGLKPQIVLAKTESSEATSSAKYVNRLVAGARSTVNGFRVTTDNRTSVDNVYLANILGSYQNQGKKVTLSQRILIKGQIVYVVTASYTGDLGKEVNQIFDTLIKEKVTF